MSNTFGFGVVRTRWVRVWLGPPVMFSVSSGNLENNSDFDITLLGIGIGPVMGVNVNIGKLVTLALDVGYHLRFYFGTGEDNSSSKTYYDADYEVHEQTPFVNFSILAGFFLAAS